MNVYETKRKIDEIYNKITEIKGFDYNTSNLKSEIDKLSDKLNVLTDTNSQYYALSKKDEQSLVALDKLVNQLYEFVNKIYKKFKIFTDSKKINDELNNDITPSKLKSIVELLLSDLLEYIELYNSGYKGNNEDELFQTLYKVIKCEYRVTGESNLLNGLVSMNVGNKEIKELIDEDVKSHLNEKDIYRRYNEVLTIDSIDSKMVYLLSLNDEGFKNELLSNLDNIKTKRDNIQDEYDKMSALKKDKLESPKETYSYLGSSILKALRIFIPNILSLAILIGANTGANNAFKKSASYKTHMNLYDTVEGAYEENLYSDIDYGEVMIRVYDEEKEGSDYRSYTTYVVEDQGLPIEEYANLRLTSADKTGSGSVNVENFSYTDHPEEIIKVYIPESIDYSDNNRDVFLEVLGHIGVFIGWLIAEMFGALVWEGMNADTGNLLYTVVYHKNFVDEIEVMMDDLREFMECLNQKQSGTYDKEEYINAKKKLDEINKEYNELLKKYSKYQELLEYNGYTRKLK